MNASIDTLDAMARAELLALWQKHFGKPPPLHTHTSFLRQAMAWILQGGRMPSTTRSPSTVSRSRSKVSKILSPGTQLIREWKGRTYRVEVTAQGFFYDGKTWRSLSAIARAITGTPWSGPAFFGVGP